MSVVVHAREQLRRLPLFAELEPEALDRVATLSRVLHLPRKNTIFSQGDSYRGMFVVLEGLAVVYKLSVEGRMLIPDVCRPGDTLADVPLFEESGILVRVPDWWKKRPRPRVGITIGDNRQKRFDADGMLDFKLRLALGDEELSDAEWRELLAGEEGLVLLRGQWVEVDRDKLTEALDHWKQVEKQAADGLSFIDGMRLLAGAPMDLSD